MSETTPQQMRELADMAGALAYHDKAKYVASSASALRTAADQLEAVQALSDAWKSEGVQPDFWIELNHALRAGGTATQADAP